MKLLASISLLFAALLNVHAQGYIVPNGVTYLGLNTFGGYEIRVLQNPTNSDYTGFWLKPAGMTPPTVFTNTFSVDYYLDEGVRVFLLSANDPLSLDTILAGDYVE